MAVLLFILSFVFNKLYSNRSSIVQEVKLAEKYIRNQQKDFAFFCKDSSTINRILGLKETLAEFNQLASKKYGIFLYTKDEFGNIVMKFWNDQLVIPSSELLADDDGEYFSKQPNGWYYCIKETLKGYHLTGQLFSIAMVPIRSEFFITTDYLPQHFFYSNSADKRVKISEKITDFPVKTVSGKTLFYLDRKTALSISYNDRKTILLRFGGILLLFLFIHLLAEAVFNKSRIGRAIGFLAIILVIFRLATYYFPSLLNLRQFELFSPVIYGSNAIQRSLGDLLINAILFCWVVLFG